MRMAAGADRKILVAMEGRRREPGGDDGVGASCSRRGQPEPKSDGGVGAAVSSAKRAPGEAWLKREGGRRRQLAPE